jgi:flagellar biosynthetic protein FliP
MARTAPLFLAMAMAGLTVWLAPQLAHAGMKLELDGDAPTHVGTALKMSIILTGLTLAPAMLLTTTSFVRIAVVLSFLKNAMGTQNMPPNQVMMGLAFFLTVAIMAPIGQEVYDTGLGPFLDGKKPAIEALDIGSRPLKRFMIKQTRKADLALFYDINHVARPKGPDEVGMHLLVPAFVISELRTSFEMGFVLYLPFLLIDLVVASTLMALGMVMVPPAMLSMPIKIMLFVLADGWNVIVASLVRSFL